jgi:hypothetical protein
MALTNRRITVSGSIDGTDDEAFPSGPDELGHSEFTSETILSDAQPQNVMQTQLRWGGECRVELTLTAQQLDGGDVRIDGLILLFEGTSEDTNDLDGKTEFTAVVPRGKTIIIGQRVDNTDEGGDFATIKMAISNALVED